jgi:hypothetical protein
VGRFGFQILPFDVTTVYPLALRIANSDLHVAEQDTVFQYLVSYVVRRAICNLTTKNYNNIFLTLLRHLASTELSPRAVRAELTVLRGEAARWPTDDEFRNSCRVAAIYPGSLDARATRAILSEIELHLRGEVRREDGFGSDFSHLDIDHIMPRSWYKHWPIGDYGHINESEVWPAKLARLGGAELSDRQQAILARSASIPKLGNLTLLNLSVNREAQAREFDEKRRLLIANTNLRLNVPLVALEEWDEGSIEARGTQLADAATEIWPGPSSEGLTGR